MHARQSGRSETPNLPPSTPQVNAEPEEGLEDRQGQRRTFPENERRRWGGSRKQRHDAACLAGKAASERPTPKLRTGSVAVVKSENRL